MAWNPLMRLLDPMRPASLTAGNCLLATAGHHATPSPCGGPTSQFSPHSFASKASHRPAGKQRKVIISQPHILHRGTVLPLRHLRVPLVPSSVASAVRRRHLPSAICLGPHLPIYPMSAIPVYQTLHSQERTHRWQHVVLPRV